MTDRPVTRDRPLAVLLGVLGVGAIGGGVYGVLGAEAVPTAWLEGTPFDSYLVPSLILMVVVAGSALAAAIASWRGTAGASFFALAAGVILLEWIAVQVAMIGYVSWLQPSVGVAGVVICGRAIWRLRRTRGR